MTPEEIAAMKAENDRLKQENEKLKKPADPKPADPKPDDKTTKGGDDPDPLREKVKKEKEEAEFRQANNKVIENALKFNLSVSDFVKSNVDLLPNEISDILKAAEKEKYDSAIDRANAVKSSMIQSFFSVQSNVDILTQSQKLNLEDYLKLTKNGKEQKSEFIYENLLEPALETLKKLKKAEEVGKARAGFASGSKVEDDYKARLMAGSRKMYLNEKGA